MKKKNFCVYKTKSPKTNYNFYEIMIFLNNVTYYIFFILANYIDVLCSAVKCSALRLSGIYYTTRTHLHQSALGSSLSFAIKYTFDDI